MIRKIIIDNKLIINMIIEWLEFHNFKLIELKDININDKIHYCSFDFKNLNNIKRKTNNITIINFEQLTVLKNKDNVKQPNELRILEYFKKLEKFINIYEIIDYSYENKILWEQMFNYNINNILSPKMNISNTTYNKNLNFLTLVNCKYRQDFVNQYLKNINYINFNNNWKNNRINLLKKSKILINLHAGINYKICEIIRIYEALCYNVIVISQNCFNHDVIKFSDKIIFCNDEDIESKCIEVLNNYDYYYDKIFN